MSGFDTAGGPDLAWCHEAVQGVSRTFALTVDALDEPMADYICTGYLLCRVGDTVEDAGHIPAEEAATLLETYRAALNPDDPTTVADFRSDVDGWLPPEGERDDDWRVVAAAPTVVATFRALPDDVRAAIRPPVREMIDGMAMFIRRHAGAGGLRIADRAELEEYCYYAAGTVGRLITNLLARADVADDRLDTLYDTAEEFGLLLQLVNVSKDVHDDYAEENNVYLPAAWLAEEDVDQEAVIDPGNRRGAARVVDRTADHARSFLDDAQRYLEAMPLADGNTLAAWGVPFLLAVGTLRELSARPEDALTDRGVKVSRQEVFAVVGTMTDAGRGSLSGLRRAITRRPYHLTAGAAD